jgi:hypothetical protein
MSNEIGTMFEVNGPYELPVGGKRFLKPDELDQFWDGIKDMADKRGCYIFAVRAGGGVTPYYIGKTTRAFRDEALNPRNQVEFVQPILAERKGTPVLFLLTSPEKKGPTNKKHIDQLEKFLIQQALLVNEELKNIHGTKLPDWGIKGVYRGGQGNRSSAAKVLMKCLGLDTSN